jgi:hypothetical protein
MPVIVAAHALTQIKVDVAPPTKLSLSDEMVAVVPR